MPHRIMMEPYRAYLSDRLNEDQHQVAFMARVRPHRVMAPGRSCRGDCRTAAGKFSPLPASPRP